MCWDFFLFCSFVYIRGHFKSPICTGTQLEWMLAPLRNIWSPMNQNKIVGPVINQYNIYIMQLMETNLATYLPYMHILLLTTNVTYHNVHSFQDLINKIVSFASNKTALKHHHVHKVANGKIITPQFITGYSWLPVTRTLYNSNLLLTRSNFHFPSEHFLYNFTLDNSNSK